MGNEADLKNNPDYGPYLNAALLCQKVLEEKDGVLSAIRIVDRVTHNYTTSTEDPFSARPTAKVEFAFLLILKSGQNPGLTNIKIVPKKPDNSELLPLGSTMHLDPPDNRGGNLVINASVTFDQQGVWWFEVFINDVRRTRIPLEVIFLPQPTQQQPPHKS